MFGKESLCAVGLGGFQGTESTRALWALAVFRARKTAARRARARHGAPATRRAARTLLAVYLSLQRSGFSPQPRAPRPRVGSEVTAPEGAPS